MFTSFNEKQERYSVPRPPLSSTTPGSTSTFNEVNKPVLPPDVDVVEDNGGYVMFVEAGKNILPADATIPGPYPSLPPPTVYFFALSYSNTSCTNACVGGTIGYYSLSSTLGVSSKIYTDSGATIPVANGYYSEGNNSGGNCYTVSDSAGTISSVSTCPTCWQYTAYGPVEIIYTDCNGNLNSINILEGESYTYCSNQYGPSTEGPCTL